MLRNIGSNWAVTLVTIAATYVLTPFIIHTLGREGYGTWTLITAMTGYMTLLSLGVPMACVRYVAEHAAAKDSHRVNQAIGSCLGLYLGIGVVSLIIGAVVTSLLTTLYNIPVAWRWEAQMACAVVVLQVSAGFVGLLPEGIMYAHHNFVARNAVRIIAVMLRLGLTVGLLAMHASLVLLALVQLTVLLFDFTASLILVRRLYPNVRVALADFDWGMVRTIFSFSMFVLLLSAGARLSFETDALVIGAYLGIGVIPFYAVANSLVIYLMDFMTAIAAVVSPMATKLNTEGRRAELIDMFLKWLKVSVSLTLMAGLFLLVLGPRFIAWWIGPEFERPSGEVLQILTISSLFFLPIRGVALPMLMGLGKPRAVTFAFITAGVVNLLLSIGLARPLGLVGVALGTAIPNMVFAGFVLVVACRELEVGVLTCLRYVVPRAALGAIPPLALLIWFKVGMDVQNLVGLAAAGVAMVVLYALTWVLFVYRNDPYIDLTPLLVRLRAWGRA
jgi:O-antigen/teichoic acid export membrane protein